MGIINQAGRGAMIVVTIFMLMSSCAKIPVLNATYRLPLEADLLRGKTLSLALEDMRTEKDFLGKGAKEDFQSFPGNISFSLARGTDPGFKIGPYSPPLLLQEAFKRRLENGGAKVLSESEGAKVGLVIVLKEFYLDLVDRKWKVYMDYEGKLVKERKALSKQSISGQAERLKLLGTGEADKVMGEILTDMVNQLNIRRLFEQAEL
ncbi:MAG: hypothetical protein ABIG67_02885 [Pseudomonadota bacterium]